MPISATIDIQKIAPGPPTISAIATPAILPVPTREASPTQKAWVEVIDNGSEPRRPRNYIGRGSGFPLQSCC